MYKCSKSFAMVFACLFFLGSLNAGPQSYYGKIRINAPGKWYLKIYDQILSGGFTTIDQFPFYNSYDPKDKNDQSINANLTKVDPDAKGRFFIYQTGNRPANPAEVKDRSTVFEMKGQTDYTIEFPYGTVGIKSFKHSLNIFSPGQSSCLVSLESQFTGSDMTASLLAQSDYDDSIGKFRPQKTDLLNYYVSSSLGSTDDPGKNYLLVANPLGARTSTLPLALALVNQSKELVYFNLTKAEPSNLAIDLTVKAKTQGVLSPGAMCEVDIPAEYNNKKFSFLIMLCDGKDLKTFSDMKHINLFQVTGNPDHWMEMDPYTNSKRGSVSATIPPFDQLKFDANAFADPSYPKLTITNK